MEINNVIMQSNQADSLRLPARNENSVDMSGKSQATPASGESSPSTPEAQSLSISGSINYIQNKLDAALISYPPFFPAGHPQRIDLIKGIKGIQEKIEKSAIPEEIKKSTAGPKLSDHASDSEISAALDSLVHFKDSSLQNASAGPAVKLPGSVVNIKI